MQIESIPEENSKINFSDEVQAENTNIESEFTSEKSENIEVEAASKQEPELSLEEKLDSLEHEIETKQQRMEQLKQSIDATKTNINDARKKLGLSPTEEETPSTLSEEERLVILETERKILEKEKEELINQQERDQLIRKEQANILQERIYDLFNEFEMLNNRDFVSILKSGTMLTGQNIESQSMGLLDPEIAKSLAKAFKEGIKLLPEIFKALPDFLEKIDKDFIKEATERVDKKLRQEKQKIEEEERRKKSEEQDFEEKSKVVEDETLSTEMNPEINSTEGTNIETPTVAK